MKNYDYESALKAGFKYYLTEDDLISDLDMLFPDLHEEKTFRIAKLHGCFVKFLGDTVTIKKYDGAKK